jgi:hypothetical protein
MSWSNRQSSGDSVDLLDGWWNRPWITAAQHWKLTFYSLVTRRIPLVEQELPNVPERLRSSYWISMLLKLDLFTRPFFFSLSLLPHTCRIKEKKGDKWGVLFPIILTELWPLLTKKNLKITKEKSDYLPRPSGICSTKNRKYKYTNSPVIITWSIECVPIGLDLLLRFLIHSRFREVFEKSNILNLGLIFESNIYYVFLNH